MQWLTPENPSEPSRSEDPSSPEPPTRPEPPVGSSGDPTYPIRQEGAVGPYGSPPPADPTEPLPHAAGGSAGEPTGPIPIPGSGGTGSPGGPGWPSPPTGGGGGGGAVPPWGWPAGAWPGGYYGPPNPPRRRRGGLLIAAILAALLLAGGGIGAGVTLALAGGSSPARVAAPSAPGKTRSPLDASAIAAKVDKGVVDITVQEAYQQGQALGTGMILTSGGEVLTNNHVVDGASPTAISVRPVDGHKTYSASVIGVDPTADVALLQMHGASGLTPVQLGDSSKVKVGTPVVAIGNADGQGGTPTVTQGAITALNRSITASDENGANPENLTGMLQTSAALVSGDSGGPLVNAAGQVVGMDTAAPSGGQFDSEPSSSPSVGWAIPTNKAFSVVSQVRHHSSSSNLVYTPHPFMGVSVTDPSQVDQGGFGGFGGFGGRFSLPTPAVSSGAYVTQALPGSPAESAGLQTGDVITSFDGHTVTSEQSLTNLEDPLHPGDTVSIGWVDSSGQSHSGTITLGGVVA